MESTLSVVLLVSILSVLFLSGAQAVTWSYLDDATGPNNWTAKYPGCGGMKQSPINIVTADAVETDLGDFILMGFGADDQPEGATMEVLNNGHVVEVAIEGDYLVSGADLGSTAYKVVQFHFHWGSTNSQGSEHTLNGKQYPGEMHIVAYNTKYADFITSLDFEDGLTVLGFFIDVQAQDNSAFNELFDIISRIRFDGDEDALSTPLVFDNILPSDRSTFYRYSGSLTTPTCNEIVTWNVFATPIMLSEAQLMELRDQYSNERGAPANITLTDTFRPVQALNGRQVYVNGTPGLCVSTSLVAMVVIKALAAVLVE